MGSGIVCGIVCSLLVLIYGVLLFRTWKAIGQGESRDVGDWKTPFVYLLKIPLLYERLLPAMHRIRMSLAVLEGGICSQEKLLRWAGEAASLAYAVLLACWLLASLTGNLAVAGIGTAIGIGVPLLKARDLHRRVERWRQVFVMELPIFLSRMLVLASAGENVMRAMERSAERGSAGAHPLYDELRAVAAALGRGESLHPAFEEFGRRCAVPEAKLFAATILMNARRGGEEFVPALRELTRQMWERRKAAARTLGEQASSRLAFPLAVIFLLIVVLVGAPTLMMM